MPVSAHALATQNIEVYDVVSLVHVFRTEVNDVVSLTRRLQVVTLARRREPAVDDVTEVHVFSRW